MRLVCKGGPGSIGWQLKCRRDAVKLPTPVVQRRRHVAAIPSLPLCGGVILILRHWPFGRFLRHSVAVRHQLLCQRLNRRTVTDGAMQGQHKPMFPGAQAIQLGSKQRTVCQIERLPHRLLPSVNARFDLIQSQTGQIEPGQSQGERWGHDRGRFAVPHRKRSSQDRMPSGDRSECPPNCVGIDGAAQNEGCRKKANRILRF